MSQGFFVTFYSYRGGVGRSLALANVATILAHKFPVAVCDLDLEAPGIEHYLAPASAAGMRGRRGFMDLVDAFRGAVAERLPDDAPDTRLFRKARLPKPSAYLLPVADNLNLMTAGGRAGSIANFAGRVRRFDWADFYEQWGGDAFVDLLREDLGEKHDFVLVDSRTGNTEIGGIATHALADLVVLMTGTNPSNLEDSVRLAETLRSEPVLEARGGRPLRILPLAARIDDRGATDDYQRFLDTFTKQSSKFVDAGDISPEQFVRETYIPYVPGYSFDGRVVAAEDESKRHRGLYSAYARIAAEIERMAMSARTAATAAASSGRIFISYRRADAPTAAFVREGLARLIGEDRVFLDTDVAPGDAWPSRLRSELQQAAGVVVLIGRNWLHAQDAYGRRRIDLATDWCREEARVALGRHIKLVPVLADGMAMPPADALPTDIASLSSLSAVPLTTDGSVEPFTALAAAFGHQPKAKGKASASVGTTTALAAYRHAMRRQHANLISFFSSADRLLDQVFVELGLAMQDREQQDEGNQRRLDRRSCSLRDLMQHEDGASTAWLVLGEPGAGKSTLARHLTWTLAGESDGPVAVYASLPTLVRPEAGHVFAEAEAALRRAEGDRAAAGLQDRLFELAAQDRVWLLLDGFDEVAPERRHDAATLIQQLRENLPKCRLAVFSRPFAGFGPGFRTARILPLGSSDQRRLLTSWLGEAVADDLAKRMQTSPQLQSLAENPLMLTLIARLAAASVDMPRHRLKLYERAIDLLLRTPYGRQSTPMRAPADAAQVLAGLALHLQRHEALAWTLEELVAALWEVRHTDARIDRLVKSTWDGDNEKFLRELADRTGVIAAYDGADGPWRFLHRQLLEYLTAKAMVDSGRPWTEFVGNLDDDGSARWAETLGLYCGLCPEPLAVLAELRRRNARVAVKALGSVYSLSAKQLLDELWRIPSDESKVRPTWDGDDLRLLVESWAQVGLAPKSDLQQLLFTRVDFLSPLPRLAWVHYAMSSLGPVGREAFFERCGRPLPTDTPSAWCEIRAGRYSMGSPINEPQREASEGPLHEVRVRRFWLRRTAVTNEEFARFDANRLTRNVPPEHPVTGVGWWDAYLYCAWIGARLPSEAEWEYACRAGTTTPFSFGANITREQVNHDGSQPYAGGKRSKSRGLTVAVGTLPANEWGLHEMHGNAWEWCEDRWHENYEGAPTDGSAWIHGGSGDRILRGGSWGAGAKRCRSASRAGWHPSSRDFDVGFRPACSSLDFLTPPRRAASRKKVKARTRNPDNRLFAGFDPFSGSWHVSTPVPRTAGKPRPRVRQPRKRNT